MSVGGRRGLEPAAFQVRLTFDGRRLRESVPLVELDEHADRLLPVREPANTKHQWRHAPRSRP